MVETTNVRQQRPAMKIINSIVRFIFIYSAFVLTHSITTNLYVEICAKPTLKGMFLSIFNVPAPHCSALRNLMDFGVNGIYSLWSIIFVWLTTELTKLIPKHG